MKEMTTAEFAKANLAGLDEPVSIRRYTQVVGTYFPKGYEPASAPLAPDLGLLEPMSLIGDLEAAEKRNRALEEEVQQLKKELAKRPLPAVLPIPVTRASGDPFAGLAKQDRDFFERKLGTGKKK